MPLKVLKWNAVRGRRSAFSKPYRAYGGGTSSPYKHIISISDAVLGAQVKTRESYRAYDSRLFVWRDNEMRRNRNN